MPISLRFLVFFKPGLNVLKLIRFEAPPAMHHQRVREAEQAMLIRELSKRLPPHRVRDVVDDQD